MKANKDQFNAYERVRQSGETNMMDVATVIELSDVRMTREQALDIVYNYDEYRKRYDEETA